MKFYISLIFISSHFFNLNAQVNYYAINGTIRNVTVGKIFLFSSSFDKNYYGKNDIIDSADIYEGQFKIIRKTNDINAYAYRFVVQSDSLSGVTGLVFIEPKNQIILIDSINEYISPIIQNSNIQNEMKFDYEKFFKSFVKTVNDLDNYSEELYKRYGKEIPSEEYLKFGLREKEIIVTGDSLFFEYAKIHTNSYVTLWKLIERFNSYGYKIEYLSIYNLLSKKIKNTLTAKFLKYNLNNARFLALNNPFPKLKLRDLSYNVINFDVKNYKTKYILIDFWFSNCGPCIREFPKYKKLFKEYRKTGFEIIGISVDSKEDVENWVKMINKNQLNWTQYLDEDGIISKKMNITSFPSNFLIDNRGVIIKKNITPEELEIFLFDLDYKNNFFDKVNLEPY